MRFVLDASVAVAALRSNEPFHDDALRRCMPVFMRQHQIIVPAIFDIEVVSALVRRGIDHSQVSFFFEEHFPDRKLVTIGPRAARDVRYIVGLTKLRAADALYTWLAVREDIPLVTLDREVLERARLVGANAIPP